MQEQYEATNPQSRAGIIAAAVVLVAVVGMWAVTGAGNLKAQKQREAAAAEKAAVTQSLGQAQAGQPWSAVAEDAGAESYVVSGAQPAYSGVYKAAGTFGGRPCYRKGQGAEARYLYHLSGIAVDVWNLGPTLGGLPTYTGENGADRPDGQWSGGPAPTPMVQERTVKPKH
jgi:hypothetical protein